MSSINSLQRFLSQLFSVTCTGHVVLFVLLDVVDLKYVCVYYPLFMYTHECHLLTVTSPNKFAHSVYVQNFVRLPFCSYTLCTCVFSSWRVFSPITGFLLSMRFSPGLCRATTDLNQLLYNQVVVSLALSFSCKVSCHVFFWLFLFCCNYVVASLCFFVYQFSYLLLAFCSFCVAF